MPNNNGRENLGNRNNQGNDSAWETMGVRTRGKFVKGPNGQLIPAEEYDAAMEAHERDKFYYKGEHVRGARTRDEEYMTLFASEQKPDGTYGDGMYAAAPDGTPLNNEKRAEMARMMHDAEDFLAFKEDARYRDYIEREEAKLGTVYKTRDELHHKVVDRIKRLEQDRLNRTKTNGDQPEGDQPGSNKPEGDQPKGDQPGSNKPEGDQPKGDRPEGQTGDIEIDVTRHEFEEIDHENLEKVEKDLAKMRPHLAELYARNRRLFVGGNNRAEFEELRGKYGELMNEYARLKAKEVFESGKRDLAERLEQKLEALKTEIEEKLTKFATGKTQEEIEAERIRLVKEATVEAQDWYDAEYTKLKTDVNVEFLEALSQQTRELDKETVDALDNGSACRKFVSKVINNKYLKGALAIAGTVGLVATGIGIAGGLASGTMAVALGYTAAGTAMGAAKGGASAFLMSRQDSKVSNVRGFASREDIATQIGDMDITSKDADTRNVAGWIMDQYKDVNKQDRSSNIKRSAVATGLGALLGAAVSGVHINDVIQQQGGKTIIGYTPISYEPQYDSSYVNVSPNHGFLQIFKQVGGDPTNQAQWDIAFRSTQRIAQKYGVISDMNKGLISPTGIPELLPGRPTTWDATSQRLLHDIIDDWAASGVIPRKMVGGNPIWGPSTSATTTMVKNSIMNFLLNATAYMTAANIGGGIGGAFRKSPNQPTAEESAPSTSGSQGANPNRRGGNPEPLQSPETPEITLNPAENDATEAYISTIADDKDITMGDIRGEDGRRLIINYLANTLSYPGDFTGSNAEAAFNNLSEEQKDRLDALYRYIVAQVADRRANNS